MKRAFFIFLFVLMFGTVWTKNVNVAFHGNCIVYQGIIYLENNPKTQNVIENVLEVKKTFKNITYGYLTKENGKLVFHYEGCYGDQLKKDVSASDNSAYLEYALNLYAATKGSNKMPYVFYWNEDGSCRSMLPVLDD